MVYGLLRALPGDHRFVDPVIRTTRWRLANLTPASGRQNHTASPSATASARLTLRCVHRIPPHVRDDRDTPLLSRRDARRKAHISEKRKQNIFCARAGQEFADAARRANQLAAVRGKVAAAQPFLIHPKRCVAADRRRSCNPYGKMAPDGCFSAHLQPLPVTT
jgi:hypothetical protein